MLLQVLDLRAGHRRYPDALQEQRLQRLVEVGRGRVAVGDGRAIPVEDDQIEATLQCLRQTLQSAEAGHEYGPLSLRARRCGYATVDVPFWVYDTTKGKSSRRRAPRRRSESGMRSDHAVVWTAAIAAVLAAVAFAPGCGGGAPSYRLTVTFNTSVTQADMDEVKPARCTTSTPAPRCSSPRPSRRSATSSLKTGTPDFCDKIESELGRLSFCPERDLRTAGRRGRRRG